MLVKTADDIPKGPHWAITLINQVMRIEPGYDKDDPPYFYNVTETTLYVFTNEEEWREEITTRMLSKSNQDGKEAMVAYHVDKVAKATLTPVVEIN